MKIKVNGHEEEAYALLLRKQYAHEIINGKKTIEIRQHNTKYVAMLYDQDMLERLIEDNDFAESPLRGDVKYIHFYTCNIEHPWSLDCRFDELGVLSLNRGDKMLVHLAEAYGFHDFDDDVKDYGDDAPLFFYFHIAEIVGHQGL